MQTEYEMQIEMQDMRIETKINIFVDILLFFWYSKYRPVPAGMTNTLNIVSVLALWPATKILAVPVSTGTAFKTLLDSEGQELIEVGIKSRGPIFK